jgi:hypothetical protein
MVRLQNKNQNKLIKPNQLKDGQLAEIIQWGEITRYIGTIVQRYNDLLITVGGTSGDIWIDINCSYLNDGTCLLRVLEKGELIEVC